MIDYQLPSLVEALRREGVLTDEQAKRFPGLVLQVQNELMKRDFPDAGKVYPVEVKKRRGLFARRSKS